MKMDPFKNYDETDRATETWLVTIHLRRRHVKGGRGQKFAKFADG